MKGELEAKLKVQLGSLNVKEFAKELNKRARKGAVSRQSPLVNKKCTAKLEKMRIHQGNADHMEEAGELSTSF